MVNSAEANWSGSTLLAKAGHILVQQDKGLNKMCFLKSVHGNFSCTCIFIFNIEP